MPYDELDDEQARQLINSEQAYDAYRSAKSELKRRFSGSMGWKSVDGHTYLYRGRNGIWRSLGRRGPETVTALIGFRAGRLRARARVAPRR